jgi:hypothetical protein
VAVLMAAFRRLFVNEVYESNMVAIRYSLFAILKNLHFGTTGIPSPKNSFKSII